MSDLKSKVLNFTYIYIALTIINSVIVVLLTRNKEVPLIILSLCSLIQLILAILYIRAVKNNNISYLRKYNTILIVLSIFVILSAVETSLTLSGFTIYLILDKQLNYGYLALVVVIIVVLIAICYFIIYYKKIVGQYYDEVKNEIAPFEGEAKNNKKISESKVLKFTYFIFVSIALFLLFHIFTYATKKEKEPREEKRFINSFIYIGISLILVYLFIRAVKKKNTRYMKIYEIMFIIVALFLVILIIVIGYVIYRLIFVDSRYENINWDKYTIFRLVIVIIPLSMLIFIIYYIHLISNYCNQTREENKAIEENRMLEENGLITHQ